MLSLFLVTFYQDESAEDAKANDREEKDIQSNANGHLPNGSTHRELLAGHPVGKGKTILENFVTNHAALWHGLS